MLDTWFSSGLWPFSTMGWPDRTQDLEFYYPTTTLVTGFDIIFFWVARMTMMAGHFMGNMPFKSVYIHGLVRDENNKKMSKSANNGIDPLLLIDKYGTDALRYTLIREVAGAGQDIRLEYNRKTDESPSVEASRNFTNKLWNASRFVMMNLDGLTPEQLGKPAVEDLELADRWMLSRYHQVVQQTRDYVDHYGLGEAAKGLYEFIWGDFCDWYIELVKSRLQDKGSPSRKVAQQTLAHVLEGTLRLLHPFMPHITEEVWHTLCQAADDRFLALQSYPEPDQNLINSDLEQQFELLINAIRTIRNLRAEADIKPGVRIRTLLKTEDEREQQILTAGESYIQDLAKVEQLTIAHPGQETAQESTIRETPAPATEIDLTTPLLPSRTSATTTPDKYQKAIRTAGLLFAIFFVAKILLALVGAVDSLILISPMLKLIGFGYTTWFIYRNLFFARDRQTFSTQASRWTQQIKGKAEEIAADLPSPTPHPAIAQPQEDEKMIAGVVGTVQVLIPLAGVVDVEALRAKLQKDLSKVEAEVQSLSQRLSNANFVDKAPADVVQGARDALSEAEKQAELLQERLVRL
ncbi:class I tRNA ligase family protein [Egbenema bharatensis]|uniref:class I tRNA ligase family protein n=1 Tax=Egbenema bharatensis TaxID=3463334 RepID=UPI003A848F12